MTRIEIVAHEPPRMTGPSRLALDALLIARGELGRGESGENNAGEDVFRYRRMSGVDRPWNGDGPWCAAFVSYCFNRAGEGVLPFKPSWGAKQLWKRIGKAGAFVETPQPGDVVCWDRGVAGSWAGHVGIVSSTESGAFHSIEGNRGRCPSKVRDYLHELGENRLLKFARI